MPKEIEIAQEAQKDALCRSLENASAIITKDYFARLDEYEIVRPSEEDIDIDIAECGRFYKLSKLDRKSVV